MAFEALNNIGYRRAPVTVVLNDNGRSYAPTISRLCETLRQPESAPAGRGFFEALGIEHRGPVDGHDLPALERALGDVPGDRPVVVHVVTTKGAGYRPAEDDPVKCLHDVPPRPRPSPAPAPLKYTDVFAATLVDSGRRDPTLVAITAAMPDSTGVTAFQSEFPERCFDVGIAEQHAVTSACGLAMGGLHPVVAVYSSFLSRAFDQVNLDLGLHRLPVVLCVDRAGVTGPDGPSHHGLLDLALLTKVPGMVVYAPSSALELQVMLADALARRDGPSALRWPSAPAPIALDGEAGSGRKGRRIRAGRDVCLLALGRMVDPARRAADRLAADGVAVSLWDIRVAAPLDPEMLDDAARHQVVVTVEDGCREGGVGSAIAVALHRRNRRGRAPQVAVLGVPVTYVAHGSQEALLAELGLDADGLVSTVTGMIRRGRFLAGVTGEPAARAPRHAGVRSSR
jgi:1-deoxy-D-xylulose-5-phosphate synthase